MRRELEVVLPGGVNIQYTQQGDVSATAVVLLHGFADSRRSFDLVLDHLPESIHVLAPSQRGHGDSSKPPKGYAITDFAVDLEQFVEAKGMSRILLVGHSMGSAVAMRYAIDHPERIGALVLVGAAPSLSGTAAAREFWDTTLEKMSDPVEPSFYREMTDSLLTKPVAPDHLNRMALEGAKVPLFVWKQVFQSRWRSEGDFGSRLGEITAPTLVVWGDRDARYSLNEQEALVRALPAAELLVYEGAGHMLHWEEPGRFAADLATLADRTRQLFRSDNQPS